MHCFNMRVPHSYIPWTSQHSCTYFCFVFHFYLLFHSQSKFCCFTWFSTVVWLESSLEPSKPCCSPWATTSPPGRTESHLPVRKLLPLCHGASEHAGPSESKGHALLQELPEWTNTAHVHGGGGQRFRLLNQLRHSWKQTFVNRICYFGSFVTPRCFISKPAVAFSSDEFLVVVLHTPHTRSALVFAFLIRPYCFGNWL